MIGEIVSSWHEWTDDEGLNRKPVLQEFLENAGDIGPWSMRDVSNQDAEHIVSGVGSVLLKLVAEPEVFALIEANADFYILWKE